MSGIKQTNNLVSAEAAGAAAPRYIDKNANAIISRRSGGPLQASGMAIVCVDAGHNEFPTMRPGRAGANGRCG